MDIDKLVKETLQRGEKVDATLDIPQGQAQELESAGKRTAAGTVILTGVRKDWLVRTAAGYAPEVEVLDPPEVRADIINLLRAAADQNGAW